MILIQQHIARLRHQNGWNMYSEIDACANERIAKRKIFPHHLRFRLFGIAKHFFSGIFDWYKLLD
jgi:hypothetical protein